MAEDVFLRCDCEHPDHYDGVRNVHGYGAHELSVSPYDTDYGPQALCHWCAEVHHGLYR